MSPLTHSSKRPTTFVRFTGRHRELNSLCTVNIILYFENRINQIIIDRFSKPWLTNGLIFPLTPAGREHKRLLNTLHSFTQKVISEFPFLLFAILYPFWSCLLFQVISERRKKLRTKRNIPTNYFNAEKDAEENGYRGKRNCIKFNFLW